MATPETQELNRLSSQYKNTLDATRKSYILTKMTSVRSQKSLKAIEHKKLEFFRESNNVIIDPLSKISSDIDNISFGGQQGPVGGMGRPPGDLFNTDPVLNKLATAPTLLERMKDTSSKHLEFAIASFGMLGGIFGLLTKVPSILQASLKIAKVGFLLILKPLADMLGNILMPFALFLIKAGVWANSLQGIERGVFAIVTGIGLVIAGLAGLAVVGAVASLGGGAAGMAGGAIAAAAAGALTSLLTVLGQVIAVIGIYWLAMKGLSSITDILSTGWGILHDGLQKISDKLADNHPILSTFFQKLADSAGFMETFTGYLSEAFEKLSTLSGIIEILETDFKLLSKFVYDLTKGKAGTNYIWKGVGEDRKLVPMANGGIVTKPTEALIGEAGGEAVIPLDKLGDMGGSGGITMNINGIFDENRIRDIMKTVAEDVLYQHKQVSGSVF